MKNMLKIIVYYPKSPHIIFLFRWLSILYQMGLFMLLFCFGEFGHSDILYYVFVYFPKLHVSLHL